MFETITPTTLVIMVMMVVIIILLVAVVAKTYKATEKFGTLQQRRLISRAALKSGSGDESSADLVSEDESIGQSNTSPKESYVMSRNNMIFKGQFDHLANNKIEPKSWRESNKSIVEEIGDSVKEKVQAITEQVGSATPTELSKPEEESEPQQLTNQDYDTSAATSTMTSEPTVSTANDVISNSGNAVETSIPESFGHLRLNNDFSILQASPKASEVAQTEDPANQQRSTDMLTYIKNLTKSK